MRETGLENFDRTLRKTHLWLQEVGDVVGPDKQCQFHALRSVLWALRDRLTTEEAFDLASHMLTLVRRICWENYRPPHKPKHYRSAEDFRQRALAGLDGAAAVNPEQAIRFTLATILRNVPEGEVDHVRQMLPEDLRVFFRQA